ncbi:hypothetical protein GGR31_002575 [Mesonia maritima]|uniref:Uncharacterized protein n=1 Tax=Mesonia maritima TaxID=1793873 RepID=A0ABU1K9F6_9FLAO|nr:hypothetical protein [Mesonia maritima]
MDIIFETIIILIFRYPGAGIRWLISRIWKSNKKFKEFLNEDSYTNGIIALLFQLHISIPKNKKILLPTPYIIHC